jgi:hypothetical protein
MLQQTRLLLVAQFWAGDLENMRALLRLIYDVQSEPSNADILLYPRRDTKIRDLNCYEYLRGKFGLEYGRSRRQLQGWPHGPNAQAMDIFRQTYESWRAGMFNYKAVLLMEADCVPLRASWLRELHEEWDSQSGEALGHWDGSGKVLYAPKSHMNGNMLFHPELVHHVQDLAYADAPNGGWDMIFWPQIAPHATPSRLIYNDYRLNTTNNPLKTPERLFRPRFHSDPENPLHGQELNPCWLHGCKGTVAIDMVRKKLLDNETRSHQ